MIFGTGDGYGAQVIDAKQTVYSVKYGFTGVSAPVWPTTVGGTVVDSAGNTWRAIRARRAFGTVSGVINNSVFEDSGRPEAAFFFQYGVVTWLSGYNAGISMEVSQYVLGPTPTFSLLEAMPFPIEEGDQYQVLMGCARTKFRCKELDNIANQRGFPDMPTEERALTSPNYSQAGTQQTQDDGS